MSSTPQRPRNMASDITKLFRHVSSQPRLEKDVSIPVTVDPHLSDSATTPVRKKITRIPLFGRPRKKSTASLSSSNYSSTGMVRCSTDVGEMSSSADNPERDRRPSGSMLTVPKPTNTLPPTSFATKISARFVHPQKEVQPAVDVRASASRISLGTSPSTGLVSSNPRPSYESASSTSSRKRSTTPRGTRPVITISRTDNLDEFRDLFEMPARPSSGVKQTSGGGAESLANSTQSLEPTYKRGQTPASVLAAAVRDQQQAHSRQPSESSRSSQRTSGSHSSGLDSKTDGRTTPKLPNGLDSSSRLSEKSSSLPSRRLSAVDGTLKPRKSSIVGKPPSIPLPALPPPPNGIPSSYKMEGVDLSETDSGAASAYHHHSRPRTTSSLPDVANSNSSPVTPTIPNSHSTPVLDADEIDIDTASTQQLRTVLRARNRQLEELTTFMLRKEETWANERKTLEKKIVSLQRDLTRRESEITGLKLILSDEDIVKQQPKPLPPGILNQSRLSPINTTALSDQENPSILKTNGRRLTYQSDSGPDSPRGSGTESTSSILLRPKRMHQRSTPLVGELTSASSRNGTGVRTVKFPPSPTTDKSLTESPYSKRISMMSIASSSSSCSSSLLPPSPSITMSSLSAIPEGSSSLHISSGNTSNGEEKRATRISRRTSASSMTSSSSTAASSAYSYSNIKRSRPPSIAQVLEKSPNMDDILEKLRPFA